MNCQNPVHKPHTSHPVNTWSKWYSTLRWQAATVGRSGSTPATRDEPHHPPPQGHAGRAVLGRQTTCLAHKKSDPFQRGGAETNRHFQQIPGPAITARRGIAAVSVSRGRLFKPWWRFGGGALDRHCSEKGARPASGLKMILHSDHINYITTEKAVNVRSYQIIPEMLDWRRINESIREWAASIPPRPGSVTL